MLKADGFLDRYVRTAQSRVALNHALAHTHTHARAHAHAHAQTQTRAHTHAHAHPRARTGMRIHERTHRHVCTHASVRTHTRACTQAGLMRTQVKLFSVTFALYNPDFDIFVWADYRVQVCRLVDYVSVCTHT